MAAAGVVRETFALGRAPWRTLEPFLFCAYHLDTYPAGDTKMAPPTETFARRNLGSDFGYVDGWSMYHGTTVPGFPVHPHRGFETITIVRQGLVDHFDSLGMAGRYGNGDVQWMTAGSGIQHSEMFPLLRSDGPNTLEAFQLWLNLPQRSKMAPPSATMFWNEQVPVVRMGESTVRVVAGSLGGVRALRPPDASYASSADAGVGVYEMSIAAGGTVTLPGAAAGTSRALYVFGDSGVMLNGKAVAARTGAIVDASAELTVHSGGAANVLVLEGRPIGEPVVQHGPFVMNTAAEIRQAFTDYQRTGFGGWRWKDSDPVHPRHAVRHVQHADGREERPPQ